MMTQVGACGEGGCWGAVLRILKLKPLHLLHRAAGCCNCCLPVSCCRGAVHLPLPRQLGAAEKHPARGPGHL